MVESMIKNILTALRAVTELQNPAIRERHWQQLMAATKVRHLTLSTSSYNSQQELHYPVGWFCFMCIRIPYICRKVVDVINFKYGKYSLKLSW
jgi:hypothetical protein